MKKHTEEPWKVSKFYPDKLTITKELPRRKGQTVGWPTMFIVETVPPSGEELTQVPEEDAANALRIVTCVNACTGLSYASLEAGVVEKMVKAIKLSGDCQLTGSQAIAILIDMASDVRSLLEVK